MDEKKFRKSPIAIACYVIAAILLVYTCYAIGSTISYLSSQFATYGMSMSDELGYVVSSVISVVVQPLASAIIIFMAGYILEELRSQNPCYYLTDAEYAAKKAEKEKKKAAKAEAKAAKEEKKAEDKAEAEK